MAQGRWTVEPGRHLCFDGQPFAHLGREGGKPVEVDGATHLIVELFNRDGVTPSTIHKKHMGGRGRGHRGRWTVEPGRNIHFDGGPFVHLEREGGKPVEVDGAAHLIVDLFNREGVTPATIYKKHMGASRGVHASVKERRNRYSMTYGQLPEFENFEHDVHTRINPDYDRPYWPKGTLYPMELTSPHEIELAETFGLEEFTPERARVGRNTRVRGFKDNERAIYEFLEFLTDRWNNGDEEAGDLASSIMMTLGYEWI